jgi:hypothetical protein
VHEFVLVRVPGRADGFCDKTMSVCLVNDFRALPPPFWDDELHLLSIVQVRTKDHRLDLRRVTIDISFLLDKRINGFTGVPGVRGSRFLDFWIRLAP